MRCADASGAISSLAASTGPVNMAFMVDIIPFSMREQAFSVLAAFGAIGPPLSF